MREILTHERRGQQGAETDAAERRILVPYASQAAAGVGEDLTPRRQSACDYSMKGPSTLFGEKREGTRCGCLPGLQTPPRSAPSPSEKRSNEIMAGQSACRRVGQWPRPSVRGPTPPCLPERKPLSRHHQCGTNAPGSLARFGRCLQATSYTPTRSDYFWQATSS